MIGAVSETCSITATRILFGGGSVVLAGLLRVPRLRPAGWESIWPINVPLIFLQCRHQILRYLACLNVM